MAFVDPNQATPAPAVPQSQQAPVAAGGAGVSGASKAAATPGQNIPAQPSAQLSAYLAANQPQAAAFSQNIASTVGGQVNAAGQAIPSAVNAYTGQLYTVPTDPTVNNAVASSPSSLTADQKATFQKELGAAGSAPNAANTFETTKGYQDASGKIQSAVEQANLWSSGNNPANLTAALAPFEGPNATTGDRTLDALLLSQTPDAYGNIQAAVAPAANLSGQLAQGTSTADAALQAAIAQDTATTPAAMSSAKQYVTGLNSTLAQYLAQAQKQADQYNTNAGTVSADLANVQPQIAALQNAIAQYNALVNGGDAQGQWGIPPTLNGVPQTFSPIDLAPYGTPSGTIGAPSLGQVATSGQYSDLAALQELLGSSGLASLAPSIDPSQAAQAGTWQVPNGGMPLSLDQLLDPIYHSVIPADSSAISTMMQYANGGGGGDSGAQIQDYLSKAFDAAAGATLTVGAPPIGAALGAYFGSGGTDGADTGNSPSLNLRTGSPIGQSVLGLDNAMTDLALAAGKQPWPGATPSPVAPANLVPGTPEFYLWELGAYPGLNIPGVDPTTGVYKPLPPGTYGVL